MSCAATPKLWLATGRCEVSAVTGVARRWLRQSVQRCCARGLRRGRERRRGPDRRERHERPVRSAETTSRVLLHLKLGTGKPALRDVQAGETTSPNARLAASISHRRRAPRSDPRLAPSQSPPTAATDTLPFSLLTPHVWRNPPAQTRAAAPRPSARAGAHPGGAGLAACAGAPAGSARSSVWCAWSHCCKGGVMRWVQVSSASAKLDTTRLPRRQWTSSPA